ncbi:hypothetical protein LWI28_006993 [Acer negundo]|uniref:Protein kinase domain-containing protein n=1 Tax=Acer negundo TaxID=4023 RepID=A0AAD5IYJ5_ACENE|nr:hypothetical protein LWI28_006993 [Acer negundo]
MRKEIVYDDDVVVEIGNNMIDMQIGDSSKDGQEESSQKDDHQEMEEQGPRVDQESSKEQQEKRDQTSTNDGYQDLPRDWRYARNHPKDLIIDSPSQALLSFQSGIGFDPTNSVLGGNWTEATSFCNWVGVSCSRNKQRVTSLNLSYTGLQGTISPLIGNLSFLVSLDLRNNSFYGNLPNEISRLHRLKELLLQFNQLEGNIPPTIHHCRELQLLSLEANRLSGGIPDELGILPSLRELNLRMNNLNGAIPSSLGNISAIQILNLRETGLTGSLPSSLLNLSSVIGIDLVKNNISGTLPMDICNYWPNIHSLNLSFNKFSGQLPSEIHRCKGLVALFLGYNMFDGGMPTDIGSLHKLQLLDLGGNNLIGTIPSTVGNLSRLRKFYIEDNYIQGNIPTDIGLLSNLNELNMELNNLTAENKNATHTKTLGTLGYIAPEYGSEGKVSTRGDVYSYGIMLLEIFTAKKPTDEMFSKEMSLRKWVAESFPEKTIHIIDDALLDPEEGDDLKATHTILLSIIELGLECTKELPVERIDMKDVVVKLNKIKLAFLPNRNF